MDTLTHIALGAVTGELIGRKRMGNRAMLWGAVTQLVPDLDVVAALWMKPVDNVIFHRSITHSVLFNFLLASLVAYICWRYYRRELSLRFLFGLIFAEFSIHLFVDVFNGYGAGLLEPFISDKYSLHSLFVVDAFFLLTFAVTATGLLFIKRELWRKRWAAGGLAVGTLYLCSAVMNGFVVRQAVARQLRKDNVEYERLLITPTPLNSWLWFVAAETNEGYYIGYQSSFHTDQRVNFSHKERGTEIMKEISDTTTLHKLQKFSRDFYIIEKEQGHIVFNDLCFGQIAGWNNVHADFAFHYYMDTDRDEDNKYVMQRGRFSSWDKKTVSSLLSSIVHGVNPSDESRK